MQPYSSNIKHLLKHEVLMHKQNSGNSSSPCIEVLLIVSVNTIQLKLLFLIGNTCHVSNYCLELTVMSQFSLTHSFLISD
jgi:hypothetical protein